MNLVERVARIIEPTAWFVYDRSLVPYLEGRGSKDDENYYYQRTWASGCRNEVDYRKWWETADHPVLELHIWYWRTSQERARAILVLLGLEEVV